MTNEKLKIGNEKGKTENRRISNVKLSMSKMKPCNVWREAVFVFAYGL
jgi:hypothetical protein